MTPDLGIFFKAAQVYDTVLYQKKKKNLPTYLPTPYLHESGLGKLKYF